MFCCFVYYLVSLFCLVLYWKVSCFIIIIIIIIIITIFIIIIIIMIAIIIIIVQTNETKQRLSCVFSCFAVVLFIFCFFVLSRT